MNEENINKFQFVRLMVAKNITFNALLDLKLSRVLQN